MATTTQRIKLPLTTATQKPIQYVILRIALYAIVIVISVILFTPLILALLGTFKTDAEIIAYPPSILPIQWLVGNWVKVWNTDLGQGGTFPRWLFNTAFLAVTTASLQVVFNSMAAFAFARLKFPGRDLVFNFMLSTLMIPTAVTTIPAFVLMSKLSLLNTFWSLILPATIHAAHIFILTQFFRSIPRDLEEAAIIDGASSVQVYKDIILPLTKPALLTVFIMQFQGMWNAFLQPVMYLNTPDMWVLNVALSIFQEQYKAQWNLTLVGAMFNAIPVLVLFFIFSKYYIEGVAYTGVKG